MIAGKKSLSIIIVNWNTKKKLRDCLLSIAQSIQKSYYLQEVIVVDNHSRDLSLDIVRKINFSFPLFILENEKNMGFSKACNQGAFLSKGDYILFLNPDTIVKKDTFERSIQYIIKADMRLGVLGVQLLDENGKIQRTCSRLPKKRYYLAKCLGINRIFKKLNSFMLEWNHQESRKVDEVMGAYFLVPKKIFYQLHGFDERFFVYYEEVDFCARLKEAGYYAYYLSTVQIYHEGGGTSNQIKGKRLFYELRSRYQYEEKHNGKKAAWITKRLIYLELVSRILLCILSGNHTQIINIIKAYKLLNRWFQKTSNK